MYNQRRTVNILSCQTMTQASALPFLPFRQATIDEATIAAVSDVLRSGWLTSNGRKVSLRAQLSAYFGGRPRAHLQFRHLPTIAGQPAGAQHVLTAAMVASSMVGLLKGRKGRADAWVMSGTKEC